MRKPSARILQQTADIYPAVQGQDRAGGYAPTYASTPAYSGVPCSAQPTGYAEEWDQGVLYVRKAWRLIFAGYIAVNPRDKVIFSNMDSTHTVYVEAARDEAGRGMAYSIKAIERT